MREALTLLVAVAVAAGCAAAPPPPVQKQPFPSFDETRPDAPTAPAPAGAAADRPASEPDVTALDPAAFAKRNPRPEFCEEGARRLQKTDREKAWAVLKACVAGGKFTLLHRLVDGAWAEELRTRTDASALIAKVIATRGGDVGGDLAQLRAARIPLFAIGPSLSHPDLYKGRLVLFRAEVKDVKLAGAKATAKLAEFAIGISERYVGSSERLVRRDSSSYSSSDGPNAYGESSRSWQLQKRFQKNEPVPTGVEALARMAQIDPFFEPGRQFVVLGRFDGVREEEGEELDQVNRLALVSIIAYYEPSAAIVE